MSQHLGSDWSAQRKNVTLNFFQPERCRDFLELLVRHGLLDRLEFAYPDVPVTDRVAVILQLDMPGAVHEKR